jgi:Flp pilus assembly protein TadG
MSTSAAPRPQRAARLLLRWRADRSGAAAVEFALTAIPFLMFIFGILVVGLEFFTMNSLEHGIETASRLIRTGQAQNASTTVAQFKQSICNNAGAAIACDAHLTVHIQQGAQWSDITPVPCLKVDGTMNAGTGNDTDAITTYAGGASSVVLVTACYKWDLPKVVPIINIGNMTDGATLLQAAATFRTEPYN